MPAQDPTVAEPPLTVSGDADRYNHRIGNDDYTQPGNLFRLMDGGQPKRLCFNIATAMTGLPEFIRERQLNHFTKADPAYGEGVRAALAAAKTPAEPATAGSPAEVMADVSNGFLIK